MTNYSPPANLFGSFLNSVQQHPHRVAVVMMDREGDEETTYQELCSLALVAASRMEELGLRRGDRCALLAENHSRWCAAYLGIHRLGAVAVPLDTMLCGNELRSLLSNCEARMLVSSTAMLDKARASVGGCDSLETVVVLNFGDETSEDTETLLFHRSSPEPLAAEEGPAREDDIAGILYTSGTTSDPKGVILSHGNLLASVSSTSSAVDLNPNDISLGVLPLFHILAQMASLQVPFRVGASVVFLRELTPEEILRAFKEYPISVFVCVPQFYYLIHSRIMARVASLGILKRLIFRSLLMANGWLRRFFGVNLGKQLFAEIHDTLGMKMKYLVTGGAPFDTRIARDFHTMGFNLHQAYGLTETSGAVTFTRAGINRAGSVGQVMDGLEIRIANETGRVDGEVLVRGPGVMKGYYNRPNASKAALRGGWFYTGDLGHLDNEGNLYIRGRCKEMIVLGSGKNIYPAEVEAHYEQSSFISEIAVLGIQTTGEAALRESLHALVVPDMEVAEQHKVVNLYEKIRYEIERMSIHFSPAKRIASWELWPEPLPRTTTRKLRRSELQMLLEKRSTGPSVATRPWNEEQLSWRDETEVLQIIEVIAKACDRERDTIHPNDSLELDLGLDSISRMDLVLRTEDALNCRLGEGASSIYTVRDLVAAFQKSKSVVRRHETEVEGWSRALSQGASSDGVPGAGIFAATVGFLFCRSIYFFSRLLLRTRVEGLPNLPEDVPYILCPNHQSFLDGFILTGTLPFRHFRRLLLLVKTKYLAGPIRRYLAEQFGLVPVDRDTNLLEPMQISADALRMGRVLLVFPEGERSMDGQLKPFHKGVAILSAHVRVPLVPVALAGFFEVWPRGKLPQQLSRVAIRIGQGLLPPPLENQPERLYERIIMSLEERVRRMQEQLIEGLRARASDGDGTTA